MTACEKLKELQITLPVAEAAVAAFVPSVRTGNLLFVSGHIAKRDGKPWAGKLGVHLTSAEFTRQSIWTETWQLFTTNCRIWKS
jgi:enamine deaminase RidA (YjgF/YER057c/UK114 family)